MKFICFWHICLMLVILFCILVCTVYIRYMRSSLAVVVFFIVISKSKRSPVTDFEAVGMKEHFRAIFVYIAANFRRTIKLKYSNTN